MSHNFVDIPIYDFIIIGSGISGLYTFTKLKERFADSKIILLEKNNYIGGRAECVDFYGTTISLGAGIVRPTDKHLLQLCKTLNVQVKSFKKSTKNKMGTLSKRKKLKINDIIYQKYLQNSAYIEKYNLNFIQFFYSFFDPSFVTFFIHHSEYTDYFDANVQKTIYEYPLDEILICDEEREMLYLDGNWISLTRKLVEKIGTQNILLNQQVYYVKIGRDNLVKLKTKTNLTVKCKKLFMCGDKSMDNIHFVNCSSIEKTLLNIGSVPFTRIYAYFKQKSPVTESTKSALDWTDKQIPINQHVSMVAYNDSEKATLCSKITNQNCLSLIRKLTSMNMDDYIHRFWLHGVHYYKTNTEIKQSWFDPVVILGEIVSRNQGWVEGCIESVDDFFLQPI